MGYPKVYAFLHDDTEEPEGFVQFRIEGETSRAFMLAGSLGCRWTEKELAELESRGKAKLFVSGYDSGTPAEPDTAHHAPSPTKENVATLVADTDKHFQPSQPKRVHGYPDEPLTKRERFAMEFAKEIIAKAPYMRSDDIGYDKVNRERECIMLGAVKSADALIAELAKEPT